MRGLTLALVAALAPVAPALGSDSDRKQSIDARIAQVQGRLAQQRRQEDSLRGEISDVTSRIRSLEAQVGDVSLRLHTLEQDLALHEARLRKLNALYRLQTRRFVTLKRQHTLSLERLNGRLRDIYESDDVTPLDIVVGTASIADALDDIEYMRAIGDQDRRIARAVATAKRQVRAARARTAQIRATVHEATRAIEVRASQTREVRNELVGARSDLSSSRQEKVADLSKVWVHRVEASVPDQASGRVLDPCAARSSHDDRGGGRSDARHPAREPAPLLHPLLRPDEPGRSVPSHPAAQRDRQAG